MTDFFGNLAARIMNPDPVLGPRAPALFEAAATVTASPFPVVEVDVEADPAPGLRERTEAPRPAFGVGAWHVPAPDVDALGWSAADEASPGRREVKSRQPTDSGLPASADQPAPPRGSADLPPDTGREPARERAGRRPEAGPNAPPTPSRPQRSVTPLARSVRATATADPAGRGDGATTPVPARLARRLSRPPAHGAVHAQPSPLATEAATAPAPIEPFSPAAADSAPPDVRRSSSAPFQAAQPQAAAHTGRAAGDAAPRRVSPVGRTAVEASVDQPEPHRGARGSGGTSRAAPRDVHVTIGRVEVRAVQPPAPAPVAEARQTGGLMSLTDYVRQRADGGHR
jgi:hypothetical protein